jgi:ABC-2 type transport system ATP-binding protein
MSSRRFAPSQRTSVVASHLTRRFGERVAVDDASFELAPGEVFALLGPNGAGKTTILRMLAGLIAPTSGSVTIAGHPMSKNNAAGLRGHIGFLTEAPGLWDRLTVEQNLLVYARLHGLPDPRRAVDETLALFGIHERAGDAAAQLSKGLKQRVALARTLLHRPEIVLLDEPTSGLDPESAREVRALILRLRDEDHTVLLSTHNLDEVERVADRVDVLRTTMVAIDTPAALRARLFGARLRVELSQPAEPFSAAASGAGVTRAHADGHALTIDVDDVTARAPTIVSRLVAAGASIQSVVPEEPSLEDVYLTLLRRGSS